MCAIRFVLTLLLATMPGVAIGGIIRVGFTAELDETEGVEITASSIRGSYSFDDDESRSDATSMNGSYIQTGLRDFTLSTDLGRSSADLGHVMHYGDDQPGLLNLYSDHTYMVAVGVVSDPPLKEQGADIDFDDFEDIHTIHIDFPWISRPVVRIDLKHSPNGDRTQRSLLPPPMEEITYAKLTFFISSDGTLLPPHSNNLLVYDIKSIHVIPEPSSTLLVCIASLPILSFSYRVRRVGD